MSGLEVAGVILGGLPLVISALEHYTHGVNTAKRYWRFKSELRSLILEINTERSIFTNTIEQLLTGIVRVEDIADCINEPGGDRWRDVKIEHKLKVRLGNAYKNYIDNVRGMASSLSQIMTKLALDPDGKPPFSDPASFKHEYRKLKFSINKTAYTEQIANLRNYNQALTRLTKQSLELESARADNKTWSCPDFTALQRYAHNLYETIRSSFHCANGCTGHAVKLRMENRNDRLESEIDLPTNLPYRVIFTDTTNVRWQEADISCIVDNSKTVPIPAHISTVGTTGSARQRVRFSHSSTSTQQGPGGQNITMKVLQSSASLVPGVASSQIRNLCNLNWQSTLSPPQSQQHQQQQLQDTCLGYLIDSVQRRHGIFPITNNLRQGTTYSLQDILTSQIANSPRLTQLAKLKIAVNLSSSVLQLYKTPWLSDNWGEQDVYFVDRNGALDPSIYEFPYVARDLSSAVATPASQTQQQKHRIIRNQTLYTLGILLIELWYGQPIAKLQIAADLDSRGTPGPAWCTAERIVETELEYEAGKRYADAVRRCIWCDFDRNMKDMSLGAESFQQAVFLGVLLPLERTLRDFVGNGNSTPTVP